MILVHFSLLTAMVLFGCRHETPTKQAPAAQSQSVASPVPDFDGRRAYDFLVTQTRFGPRNPGSAGHRNCLNYLQSELQSAAEAVNTQSFTVAGYNKETLKLTNVIASFNLKATTRILLLAHWDTRPRADNDPDPKKRDALILGANDGASGVAVLLESAHHLKLRPPQVGVDLLFVDGEDYGKEGDAQYYLLGAKHFAKHLPPGFVPSFGILLDMIGDKQLEIPKDRYSLEFAPEIVELVWSTARDLGISQFSDNLARGWTTDDHVPLNQAGIKTIDLIDFEYPDSSNRFWHSVQDTPDKCSAESLEAVGTVLMHVIYNYKP